MRKNVTINEVAEQAGVSVATISRVVNDNYPVKEETRERVKKIIEELGYTPNVLARSMVKKKTFTIGVIVSSVTNPFFNNLIEGINNTLAGFGYTILLCNSHHTDKIILLESLVSKQVDGIIYSDGVFDNNDLDKIVKFSKKLPIVCINCYNEEINYVSCDQILGTKLAFDYLIEKGHENILFIRSTENSPSYDIKEKLYIETFERKYFLKVDKGNISNTIVSTREACGAYFKNFENITAIFACNDLMAIGAIKGLQDLNINVPKDIEIIGFDNILYSDLIMPSLTTIDQQAYTLGEISSNRLKALIEKTEYKVQVMIKPELIKRESC